MDHTGKNHTYTHSALLYPHLCKLIYLIQQLYHKVYSYEAYTFSVCPQEMRDKQDRMGLRQIWTNTFLFHEFPHELGPLINLFLVYRRHLNEMKK